jgi:hypothetical protein
MLLFHTTLDVEYIYKTGNIFPMTLAHCKGIANEHTLLNRKHVCDARKLLCTRDFTKLG